MNSKSLLYIAILAGTFELTDLPAWSQTICPTTAIANGNPADATLVTSWFSCKAPTDNPRFTGQIGVGTSTPSGTVDISGTTPIFTVESSSTLEAYGRFRNTTTDLRIGQERAAGGALMGSSSPYAGILDAVGAYPLQFGTNNSLRMTIDANGLVGIGTASPSYKLDIVGGNSMLRLASTGAWSEIQLQDTSHVSYIGDYSNGLYFFSNSPSVPTLVLTPGSPGNAGIGTTNPLATLVVSAGGHEGVEIQPTYGSGVDYLQFYNRVAGTYDIARFIAGAYRFDIAGTAKVTIDSSGNVGIGTITPGQKLDVVGTIRQSNCTTAGTLSANTSGDIICTSDARLKNIRGNYTDGLTAVMQIQPKLFSFKPTKADPIETFVHAGFIAQNVRAAIPQASALQHDGYYSLDTTAVLAAAINSIKQLKAENDRQAIKIAEQNAELQKLRVSEVHELIRLKARLDVLESLKLPRTAQN